MATNANLCLAEDTDMVFALSARFSAHSVALLLPGSLMINPDQVAVREYIMYILLMLNSNKHVCRQHPVVPAIHKKGKCILIFHQYRCQH